MCLYRVYGVYLLGNNRGHWDLQELLLEGNKGEKAGVEEAKQLQYSGKAEQHWNTRVLQNTHTHKQDLGSVPFLIQSF